jgi:sulfatase maturation enzyme AslB (radical SAM superfamily)
MTFLDEHQKEFDPISVDTHSPYEALNSEPMERIRQAMLKGETVPGCNKCYKEEEATGLSMRTSNNLIWGADRYLDGHTELRYLEVAFGNYCNLSCRTCGSGLSTSWHDDDMKLKSAYPERENAKPILDVEFNWKPSDFDLVEEIKFTGGEPMLHPNFIKFLDIIIEGGNETHITLDIFTNTSWVPKDKVISRLNKFKRVKIWLSIDGVGTIQDYVRNGSSWDKVEQSADTWCKLEHDNPETYGIILTPTLNMYNILTFTDVVEWWISLRNKYNLQLGTRQQPGDLITSIVYFPDCLNVKYLPEKEKLISHLEKYKTQKNNILVDKAIGKIILLLTKYLDVDIDLKEFVEFTKDLDKLRSQSFKQANPKLYELVESHLNKQNLSYENINGRLND